MTEQKKTRRQMLEQFVAHKPDDAFARYGLAMEYMNNDEPGAAEEHFRALLARNTHYVPAYLMYAQLLVRQSRGAEARNILLSGMEVASREGQEHARSEMESLLAQIS